MERGRKGGREEGRERGREGGKKGGTNEQRQGKKINREGGKAGAVLCKCSSLVGFNVYTLNNNVASFTMGQPLSKQVSHHKTGHTITHLDT